MTNPNEQPLGALYVRSASSAPEDEQRLQIEKYAAQDEARIIKTYSDIGISGISSPKQRPGLSALLDDARQGQFNLLYITGLDRLGRRMEHVADIIGQLQAAGVTIKAGGQSVGTPDKELVECVESLKQMTGRSPLL